MELRWRPIELKSSPNGVEMEPKGAQLEPKWSPLELKSSPNGAQIEPKWSSDGVQIELSGWPCVLVVSKLLVVVVRYGKECS